MVLGARGSIVNKTDSCLHGASCLVQERHEKNKIKCRVHWMGVRALEKRRVEKGDRGSSGRIGADGVAVIK